MAVLPRLIYRFHTVPTKTSVGFCFAEIDKLILKFKWKSNVPSIVKPILTKINNVRRLVFLNYETYYKATVVNAVWC